MVKQIKISIIIPIYNVEKYIRQCLESVINQTYKNIEIIVVNDGTKDNSMKIIGEYLSDTRIRIINKENGGLSSARNEGLKEANGEYILFIDSDDWIELHFIETLVQNLEDEDIIGFNFYLYDEREKIKKENCMLVEYNKKKRGEYFLSDGYEIVVWNKLYRKEFLYKNNLKFLEGIIHEDIYFTFKCYMSSPKVKYIKNNLYNYRINRDGSIIDKVKQDSKLSLNSLEIIKNELQELLKNSDHLEKFIQLRIRLKIISLEISSLKIKKCRLKKEDKFNLTNLILDDEELFLSNENKKILKKEFQNLILQTNYTKIKILNFKLWINGILNFKILKKLCSRKLKFQKHYKIIENEKK